MSDFLKGVGTGLAGSNGIAGAVRSIALAPYLAAIQEQKARSQAAVQALNEAKLAEVNSKQTANQYWAKQIGIPESALGGYSPAEISQNFSNTREGQMMRAAGMLGGGQPSVGDGVAEVKARSDANIQRNAALLNQLLRDSGAIENALKGGGMYQYKNNGAAFNPFYGTSEVSDKEVRELYKQEKQAGIAEKRAKSVKALRSGAGRGGSPSTGWTIKQGEDGKTYRVNSRTGEHAPMEINLKFGNGRNGRSGGGGGYKPSEYDEMLIDMVRAGKLSKAQAIQMSEAQK